MSVKFRIFGSRILRFIGLKEFRSLGSGLRGLRVGFRATWLGDSAQVLILQCVVRHVHPLGHAPARGNPDCRCGTVVAQADQPTAPAHEQASNGSKANPPSFEARMGVCFFCSFCHF